MNSARFSFRARLWLALVFVGAIVGSTYSQGFRLTEIRRENGATVAIDYQGRGDSYYLLRHGTTVSNLDAIVTAVLGVNGASTMRHNAASAATGFYRVLEYPIDRAGDVDNDRIDDGYELQTPGLNPLDSTDATKLIPGGGGKTYLDVYRDQQTSLTTLAETSPFQGEDSVAVTRETILRFTRPLATNAVPTLDHLYATFGGRRILSRVEWSSDRRTATLFPLENLPASARIRVTLDPGDLRDDLGRRLDAAGTGEPGSIARIDFDTSSVTPVGETAVIGHVYASEPVPNGQGGFTNRPLTNVTITVDGAEESVRTTTDATGFFRLQPAPAGRFFVHIDGRTATDSNWPQGAYYPVVGKAWEAIPGVITNLANASGVIYLPLIPADALQPVSATVETVVAFPASVVAANPSFAGVEVRIPPNNLFDNNGQRGGRVGLAPVASDRLPEPLPAGLEHLLDITVQSDGPQNFDRPVPVRFPNLPSPTTGQRLPPGEKTALVSFNHDLGRWEVVGSMTASADGLFLESDPGVGVRQPGWHGWQRLTWPVFLPPITFSQFPFFPPIDFQPANPPRPPGPFPPEFPSPTPPEPPIVNPEGPGPQFPIWPDSDPNTWPPVPPWPDPPPDGNPDSGENPPPDGPNDGPTGAPGSGGSGDGGGVSAGPFCLSAEIEEGCANSTTLLPGAATVAINPSGGSQFDLTFSQLNGVVTAEVRARASGRVVFATQVNAARPPNSVGFGPAQQAFAHVFRQTTASGASGDEVVQLVTLRENAQSFAAAKTITLGASFLNASSVRFSPHGRYLVYTALKTDGQIALAVVDVVTRDTVFNGSFPYSTSPVLVQPQDMAQFGPDCADRTMVFRFGDTPTTLAWHLINLESRRVVVSRRIAPGSLSSWEFSSCGDAVQLVPGSGQPAVTFATLDGRQLANPTANSRPALATVSSMAQVQSPAATNIYRPRALYSRGLHYWLLVDMLTGQVVRRGRTGGSGVLMEGVLLAPNRPFRLLALRAADLFAGRVDFISGNVGAQFRPPVPILEPDDSGDRDGDGLGDFAEYLVGTRPDRVDSNGDGINDAAAVRAGLDPVEGGTLATGIVASVPLSGSAVDVCAIGDRVLVALGTAGVAILQHPPGRNPTIIARVDTPGNARRVACSGNLVAVADGSAGLQIVDITDPPAARIRHYLPNIGEANCVVVADDVAFVGTQGGNLVLVELVSGTEVGRVRIGGAVQDLQFGGDHLYVLSNRRLLPYLIESGELIPSGPGVTSGSGQLAERLFVGGGFAYVTHWDGYRVFDLANPDDPSERTTGSDTQFGWSQLVANGSGLGLAAAAAQLNANNQVQIYNLSDPARNDQFLTRYTTPAGAVSVAIHLGVGYVAATTGGLQVLNYLAADTGTNPPSIELSATFPLSPARVESGRFVAIQANARDDVQVSEVEFYLDGERVAADGGFPFEYAFFAPTLTSQRTQFRIRAKAFDTAGNFTWSDEIDVRLAADLTSPRVRPAAPSAYGFAVSPVSIGAIFNEPIDPATVTPARFTLRFLGADRTSDTADDRAVAGEVVFRTDTRLAELRFPTPANGGRFQATVARGVTDLAGNATTNDLVWAFEIVLGSDTDQDGLTDEFETANGLDPQKTDQNNNGLPDALEDFDGDGLTNGQEMLLGTHPGRQRTFEGILDRDLDRDGDWLTDVAELGLGTDRILWDTDGDGWNDEIEVATGSNPLVRNGYLPGKRVANQTSHVLRLVGPQFRSAQVDTLRLGDGQAMQATSVANVLRLGGPNELGHSIVAAQPPVRLRVFDVADSDFAPYELPRLGAFVVEAEDFNHSGGQHLDAASIMPYLGGAYASLAGVLNVDYFNADTSAASAYRPVPPPNSVRFIDNLTGRYGLERPGWSVALNYRLASPAPGAWQQYTRRIPPGDYWVWAALSADGFAADALRGTLDLVTDDPTQPAPALVPLGSFVAPGSGGAGQNSLVLLQNASGTPSVVHLDQTLSTFRFGLSSGDLDWFVFVPIGSAP